MGLIRLLKRNADIEFAYAHSTQSMNVAYRSSKMRKNEILFRCVTKTAAYKSPLKIEHKLSSLLLLS